MSIKYGNAKVSTTAEIDGVDHKVSRVVSMPKTADAVEDLLPLCDGKLKSARGQKPGLIDAAISGINAYQRREEVKQIELLLGGKDAAKAELTKNMLAIFPNMPKAELEKSVETIVSANWTEEQEKARQSLKIEKIEKGAKVTNDEEEEEGEEGEGETESTETETAKA